MKKNFIRKISLALVFTLVSTMAFTGCSTKDSTSENASTTAVSKETEDITETVDTNEAADTTEASSTNADPWADVDISKEVKIVGYLLGGAPAGMDGVMEALNAKLKEKINATLEIRYLGWADYTTKYPLVLAAGEDVDFMFTADWCMYSQEAIKNAFYEVTEDNLQKYMPRHYANCNPVAYEQAKLNDKMYMITTSTPDKRCACLAYRKDLADKYGITELNKLSDFTEFFKAVAEKETDIAPMYLSSAYDAPYIGLANEYGNEINIGKNTALCYATEDTVINVAPLYEEPYNSAFKAAYTTMKEWYDAGYVNKDILSNTITSRDSFLEGKSAVAFGNSVDMQSVLASAADKGYEVGIVPLVDSQGKTAAISYLNNGVAIAATSKNPERTMMLLDLIMEEKEFNYLAYFGIEGENYAVTDAGKIGLPEGVTDETNTYPADSAGFWFTNKDQHLPLASWSDDYIALKEQIPGMIYVNPYTAFSADITNIQTETANITQVMQQYAQPLTVGMVDNVDEAMATLKEKLMAAGIESVQEEIQNQTKAFLGQ